MFSFTIFIENGFNFLSFYELIKSLKDQHSNSETKYDFLLLTANKYTLLPRNPISMYDFILTPKTFFISIEGDSQQLQAFNEDKKYIIDDFNVVKGCKSYAYPLNISMNGVEVLKRLGDYEII